MAVVFPAPAGAIASCSRAPEVHIWRTSAACPASSAVPFAAISSSARSTATWSTAAVASSGGGDEAPLGVEDPLRGVQVGAGDGVDRRPVDPPQHLRFLDVVSGATRATDRRSSTSSTSRSTSAGGMFSGHVDGADLPLRFGPDMPDLPGGAAFLHHRQDVISRLCDPAGVGDRGGRRRCGVSAVCTIAATASGPPSTAAASSSQVARCSVRERGSCLASRVSKVACWASCKRFDRGRWPAMIMLELDGELAAAGFDVGYGGSTSAGSVGVDTDDLPDRPLRRVGAGPFGEPHPEAVAEVLLQGGVVGFRCGHGGLEQDPAVDGQPASVEGLDLVRDRDVGVQVGVAGAAVAVGERRPRPGLAR